MRNQAPAIGPRGACFAWRAAQAALAVLLAACGAPTTALPHTNSTDLATTSGAPPNSGIEFMLSGSSAQQAAYQALVSAYQQRYPGQTVNLVGIADEADYQGRLAADIAAGRPADVIVESYTQVMGLVARGLLTPVAPYLAASQTLKPADFTDDVLGAFIFNRALQCLPLSASGLVVFYNKDLFQQAGLAAPGSHWSKQEFVADAQALTRDTNGDGRPDQYGLGVQPSLINLTPFIWQLQGQLLNKNNWPTELELRAPAVVTATTWLVNLQTHYHVAPDQPAELAASGEQRFLDGRLGMIINTAASVPGYRQITNFDWDVAPLPTNNANPTNVLLADGLCLTAGSANKAAAWQFIAFAGSAEGQALLAQAGAIVPAQTAVARSAAFLNPAVRPAHSQVLLEAASFARPLPKLENWTDIQAVADEELAQAFYGQKDVALALAAASTRSEEYFKIHIAN